MLKLNQKALYASSLSDERICIVIALDSFGREINIIEIGEHLKCILFLGH
jgi:hypothetical protein